MPLSNAIIAQFLRDIPQSNQPVLSIKEICSASQDDLDYATLLGYARLLETIGVLHVELHSPLAESRLQASSQTAKYALLSLADFVSRNESIIADWKTRGIQDDIFANGASFLRALEQERLNRFEDTQASRFVKVAQVLIKRINPDTGQHELLFQFDHNAKQYQLIGGRWSEKDGDDMRVTMVREIIEELPLNDLQYPDSFQLESLIKDMEINGTISTTFGALTNYRFWVYHLTGLQEPLRLQTGDYWVPIEMVLNGVVSDQNASFPFTSPDIYRRIDGALPNGLSSLASSFITPMSYRD